MSLRELVEEALRRGEGKEVEFKLSLDREAASFGKLDIASGGRVFLVNFYIVLLNPVSSSEVEYPFSRQRWVIVRYADAESII